jgi:hypothetical protein
VNKILPIASLLAAGGLIVHLGIGFLVRLDSPDSPIPEPDRIDVAYVGDPETHADPVLREQAVLLDTAPIFMPTRWNPASRMDSVASLRQAAEVFSPFAPEISLPESVDLPESLDPAPVQPSDDLGPADPAFILYRYGNQSQPLPPGLDQRGIIEVIRMDREPAQNQRIFRIPEGLADQAPEALWTPMRIYLQVDQAKPLGPPVISRSSGFSGWDQAVQTYLASLAFYRLLEDGYYRVILFP